MIFTLGPYTLDVDVEKTKRYYDTAKSVGEECTCDGCQNFEKAVGTLPHRFPAAADRRSSLTSYQNITERNEKIQHNASWRSYTGRILGL